ncbi:MAG: 3-phosphoshikimate 1-carboxyvinyltransferase [Clostridia bacterium]|nr:3-phosphoshikimate 1-carboxyvinyltransferase [Clostridia bacterium]MBQ7751896.1 3-phosphoshikimate 1-carboxyvinyltransferase [Clostridia bacterium]
MKVKISPSNLSGKFSAPPSKSFAHRSIICAALSNGKSRIYNLQKSEDILATLDCISAFGVSAVENPEFTEIIGNGAKKISSALFPCRESGSTLRFFFPIALSMCGKSVFTGSPRLIERGIGLYEDILKDIKIVKNDTSIEATGNLTSGEYTIRGNVSSQYITGLLLSLPLLDGDSKITVIPPFESRPYVDITISVMEDFGVEIKKCGENSYFIRGNQNYTARDTEIEGDWSNSAVFFALNALGSDITVAGLNAKSLQGDIVITEYIKKLDEPTPKIDISDSPDLAPVLFALAAAKNGAEFTGTARLRIKESDRAKAMQEELQKFGIKTEIYENSVKVFKGELQKPSAPIFSHNDHRIVMATAMLLTVTGGSICGAEAVSKSFPDFFDVLKSLGAEVSYES